MNKIIIILMLFVSSLLVSVGVEYLRILTTKRATITIDKVTR